MNIEIKPGPYETKNGIIVVTGIITKIGETTLEKGERLIITRGINQYPGIDNLHCFKEADILKVIDNSL